MPAPQRRQDSIEGLCAGWDSHEREALTRPGRIPWSLAFVRDDGHRRTGETQNENGPSSVLPAPLLIPYPPQLSPQLLAPNENGPSSALPAPLLTPSPPEPTPQLRAPPSAPNTTLAMPREAIGTAEMVSNGAIRLHLWPPAEPTSEETFRPGVLWGFPQERIGYGEIEIEHTDGVYILLLKHLGGLRPVN